MYNTLPYITYNILYMIYHRIDYILHITYDVSWKTHHLPRGCPLVGRLTRPIRPCATDQSCRGPLDLGVTSPGSLTRPPWAHRRRCEEPSRMLVPSADKRRTREGGTAARFSLWPQPLARPRTLVPPTPTAVGASTSRSLPRGLGWRWYRRPAPNQQLSPCWERC